MRTKYFVRRPHWRSKPLTSQMICTSKRTQNLMIVDTSKATPQDVYHLLIGIVTPRPIAWVTTLSPAGIVNLAPFSFFNAFGSNPPVVVFSPTRRRDGT